MSMTYDSIVAGAGIWGCTLARRLAEAGKKVLVLEKRAAIGGNCRCEVDPETGIEVHTYGSHVFHTGNEDVWRFVRRFTDFNDYRHCVLAKTMRSPSLEAKAKIGDFHSSTSNFASLPTYHLPIGCTLLKEFFGREIKPSEMTETERMAVFDAFIRGYTSKQWGVPPEKVDPSIIARLKVCDNDSTDYFDDQHQGIPVDGYNKMFARMLDHPNISVETEMSVKMVGSALRADRNADSTQMSLEIDCGRAGRSPLPVYYSGPIDALFNYKFGALPWRTLRFERETLPIADYQGNSVVNYTDVEVPWTRIHEFKHYHPEWREKKAGRESGSREKTIIMREYSGAWQLGDEPYYPVDNVESRSLLAKYQEEIERFNNPLLITRHFSLLAGGRLGQYKYLDMDKAIEAALQVDIG